jgi:membrane associated rhomboid family serine protease
MPRHDPYLRDQNVSSAAGLNLIGAIVLGALLGWAVVGWFDLKVSETVGVVVGAVVGAFIASALLAIFGGRSTR